MSEEVKVEIEILEEEIPEVELSVPDENPAEINVIVKKVIEADHTKLSNREVANQHPISAITGLQSALDGKQPVGSYATTSQLNAETLARQQADANLQQQIDSKQPSGNYATKAELQQEAQARQNADAGKVDKVQGKGLSENDYTTAEKNKLAGIEAQAQKNIQSDWNQSDTTKDDYIKNKPSIPTKTSDLTNDSDYQTGTQVETSISTHNTSNLAHDDIRQKAQSAEDIAKGRAKSEVFNTFADMETWLKDIANKGTHNIGDNLYIKAQDVSDYWISAVLQSSDPVTGYYYTINKLEAEKPDLTNMVTTNTAQTITGNKDFTGSLKKNGNDVATELYVNNYHDATKENIFRYATVPTAGSDNLGKIIQYIGTTDSTYTNGYFYKCGQITLVQPVTEHIEVTQSAGVTMGDFTTDVNVFKSALNPTREWTYQFSCVGKPSQISLSRFTNGFEFTSLTRDTVFDNSRLHYYSWVDSSNNYYYTTTEVPNSDTIFYVGSTDDLSQPTTTNSGWEYVATNTRRTDDPWGMWIIGSSDEEVSLSDYGIYSSSRGVVGDVLQVHYYPQVLGETSYQWQQHNVQPAGSVGNFANQDLSNLSATGETHFAKIEDTSTSSQTSSWSANKINTELSEKQDALGYTAENSANKVTSISSSSTNTQYPSAKCVYDIVGNIEATLQAIRGV